MESDNESKWIICRICLKAGTDMVKIFEDAEQNLLKKIEECGGIEIDATADLPDSICSKCLTLLKAATIFRKICQKTQVILYKQFCNVEKDKEEQPESPPPEFPVEYLKFKKKDDSRNDIIFEQHFVETNPTEAEVLPTENNLITTDCANEEYSIEYEHSTEIVNEAVEDSLNSDEAVGYELIKSEKSNDYSDTEQEMVEYVLQIDGDQKAGNFKIIPQIKQKTATAATFVSPPSALPSTKQKRKYKSVQVFENSDGVYECPKCENVYANKHKFILHLKIHNQDRPHECEICFKRFAQTPQLARHMNTHTGQRPFQCTFCPASFADPSTRIKHIRTHTNERPYTCEVCNKSFTYSNVLKVHKMIHTGEKPFSCRHCGKKFSQSHHRKNHERTHSSLEN